MKGYFLLSAMLVVVLAGCNDDQNANVVKPNPEPQKINLVSEISSPLMNGSSISFSAGKFGKSATRGETVSPESLSQRPTNNAFGVDRYVQFDWSFAYEYTAEHNYQPWRTLPPDVEVLNTDHNYLCHYVFAYADDTYNWNGPAYFLDYFFEFEQRTDYNGQTYNVVTGVKNRYCGGCVNCPKCMPWGCSCGCGGWDNGQPILNVNPNFVPNYNPDPQEPDPGIPSVDDNDTNDNSNAPESDDIIIQLPVAGLADFVIQPDDFYLRSKKEFIVDGEAARYYRSIAVDAHSSDYVSVNNTAGEDIKITLNNLDDLFGGVMLDSIGDDSIWTIEVYLWPSTQEYNEEKGVVEIKGLTSLTEGYYLSSISEEKIDSVGKKYRLNDYADFYTTRYKAIASAYIGRNGQPGADYQYVKLSLHIAKSNTYLEDPVRLEEDEWIGYNFE